MPTKKTTRKPAPGRAKPAAQRKPRLARYIAVTGDLAAAMKGYQKVLRNIDAGKKIDVKAFDRTIDAMNKAIEQFEALSDKQEQAVLDYVDVHAA